MGFLLGASRAPAPSAADGRDDRHLHVRAGSRARDGSASATEPRAGWWLALDRRPVRHGADCADRVRRLADDHVGVAAVVDGDLHMAVMVTATVFFGLAAISGHDDWSTGTSRTARSS